MVTTIYWETVAIFVKNICSPHLSGQELRARKIIIEPTSPPETQLKGVLVYGKGDFLAYKKVLSQCIPNLSHSSRTIQGMAESVVIF